MATISWINYVTGNVTVSLTLDYTFTRTTSTTGTLTCNYNCSIPNGDDSIQALGWGIPDIGWYVAMKAFNTDNYGYSGSFTQNITGLSESGGTINISAYMYRTTSSWSVISTTDTRSTSITYGNVVPTITQNNITEIGATSFKINAYSNASCNTWQYKLNSGNWTTFNSGASTNVSYTISNLSPNVSYTVQIRATEVAYGAVGTSGTKTATTLGGMVINSATDLTVHSDITDCYIDVSITYYNASYHNYIDVVYGTTLFTFDLSSHQVGTFSQRLFLDEAKRTVLLNTTTSRKYINATLSGYSMSGSTQIGSASEKAIKITIDGADYMPSFTVPTYEDNNATTVAITEDNQNLIYGYSTLNILGLNPTCNGGATFGSWTFKVGNTTKNSSLNTSSYSFGIISADELKITLTDSRGYTAERTIELTTTRHSKPTIENAIFRRVNNIEANATLSLNGRYTSVGNNSIQISKINVNSTDYPFTMTYSGSSYSFSGLIGQFNVDNQYTATITISDKLDSSTFEIVLPKGKPLVAFRSEKVGINIANPTEALDVLGNVKATSFIGNLTGNCSGSSGSCTGNAATATIATKATQDGSGNNIVNTYMPKSTLKDYVIAQGTSNGWTYQKWNSGKIEAWYLATPSITSWSAWGGMYESNAFTVPAYPTITINNKALSASLLPWNNNIGLIGNVEFYKNASGTLYYYFLRGTAGNATQVNLLLTLRGNA